MARRRKGKRTGEDSGIAGGALVGTYQTRVSVYAGRDRAGGDAALAAYGELYGLVERKLFAAFAALVGLSRL